MSAVDLFAEAASAPSPDETIADRSLSAHLEQAERTFLIATLQAHQGAIGEAASRLGISLKTLWEKMKRHGIARQEMLG